jgi:putative DNA primase/helicase
MTWAKLDDLNLNVVRGRRPGRARGAGLAASSAARMMANGLAVPLNVEAIPESLRARRQWIAWCFEERAGDPKATKVPYNARTGGHATSTNAATWSLLSEVLAVAGDYDGIGYVFAPDDGVVGIDLDCCRDPNTGAVEPWAVDILGDTRSYTEVSPSGRGLHILVTGTLPPGPRKRGPVEMYDRGRYFTVTGQRLEELPGEVRAPHLELAALHTKLFPAAARPEANGTQRPAAAVTFDDSALLDRAREAKNGAKFARLYDRANVTGYNSPSEADLALCHLLSFWTGPDPLRVDRLFRASALMRPKWDEQHGAETYGAMTIARAVAGAAETYTPRGQARQPEAAPGDGPVLVQLSTVASEPVEWCWPGRVAVGKLALIIGNPGEGKSTLTYDITSRVTVGRDWPDGATTRAGAVIILSAEDGLADTVRPRVDAQRGDATHVYVLRAVRIAGRDCSFNLDRDLPALEQAIRATGALLVTVDPLSAYLGARDSFKDSDIRGLLTPLAEMADRCHVAVVGVLHLTKGAQRRLLLRAQGNIAFVAQARTVLAVGEDPEAPGRRLLVSIKNNLGPAAPALAFRLGDAGLVWEPAPVEGSAEDLLATDELGTRSERRALETATEFLRDTLTGGPVASKELMADARANGIATRTLERAKQDLRLRAGRHGRGPWYWMLPASEPQP